MSAPPPPPPPPARRGSPLQARLLLGLVAALGFFAAGEVLARLLLPAGPPVMGIEMQEDPDVLWTLTTSGDHPPPNRLGLRSPELGPRGEVTGRFLTLGDSSVYGDTVGDDQVFSAVAARSLSAIGPRVDAANGGIPGYSTVQATILYTRVHEAVAADVVVIATLWSDASAGEETDVDHIRRVRSDLGFWGPVNRTFRSAQRRSALFVFLRQVRHGNLSLRAPEPPPREKVGWVHADAELPFGTVARVPVEAYRQNLDALVGQVRGDGAEPAFLLLPHPYDDLGQTLPERLLAYRQAMRASAAALSVPLVDGEAWFKGHPSRAGRFSDDIHPNTEGHAQIAAALLSTIGETPSLRARLGRRAPP
jgi:lysophospholipase L1-like esterase